MNARFSTAGKEDPVRRALLERRLERLERWVFTNAAPRRNGRLLRNMEVLRVRIGAPHHAWLLPAEGWSYAGLPMDPERRVGQPVMARPLWDRQWVRRAEAYSLSELTKDELLRLATHADGKTCVQDIYFPGFRRGESCLAKKRWRGGSGRSSLGKGCRDGSGWSGGAAEPPSEGENPSTHGCGEGLLFEVGILV